MLKKISWVASLVALDQLTKFLALRYFGNLALLNPAGSFGLNIQPAVLLALNAVVVVALAFFLICTKTKAAPPLLLILAGGIGNLADRVFRGAVVDFIDLKIWPSFNLADSMLAVGAVWLIIAYTSKPKNKSTGH